VKGSEARLGALCASAALFAWRTNDDQIYIRVALLRPSAYVNYDRVTVAQGDSGGPLMIEKDNGRWTLIGTVSHGIKCAAPYLPGVYMRTTYYKPWLQTITGVQ